MTDKRFYIAAENHIDHLIETANYLKATINTAQSITKANAQIDKTHRLANKITKLTELINNSVHQVQIPVSW